MASIADRIRANLNQITSQINNDLGRTDPLRGQLLDSIQANQLTDRTAAARARARATDNTNALVGALDGQLTGVSRDTVNLLRDSAPTTGGVEDVAAGFFSALNDRDNLVRERIERAQTERTEALRDLQTLNQLETQRLGLIGDLADRDVRADQLRATRQGLLIDNEQALGGLVIDEGNLDVSRQNANTQEYSSRSGRISANASATQAAASLKNSETNALDAITRQEQQRESVRSNQADEYLDAVEESRKARESRSVIASNDAGTAATQVSTDSQRLKNVQETDAATVARNINQFIPSATSDNPTERLLQAALSAHLDEQKEIRENKQYSTEQKVLAMQNSVTRARQAMSQAIVSSGQIQGYVTPTASAEIVNNYINNYIQDTGIRAGASFSAPTVKAAQPAPKSKKTVTEEYPALGAGNGATQ